MPKTKTLDRAVTIIWSKPNPMPESVTDRCTKAHEYIFLLSKQKHYYFNNEAIKEPCVTRGTKERKGAPRYGGNKYSADAAVFNRTKSGNAYAYKETRNKRSVWTIQTQAYSGAHFATFPSMLAETCILAGSRPGDMIIDPFMGSGTTAKAAVKYGRLYAGCEINPAYMPLIEDRINGTQMMF